MPQPQTEFVIRPTLKFIKLAYLLAVVLAAVIAGYWKMAARPPQVPVYVPLILPAFLLLITAIRHIQRSLVRLTITAERLRYEKGFLSKSTRTMELVKVQDVRVDQSLGQRLFGIGDLGVETAGETSRLVIEGIDHPQQAAERILDRAHQLANRQRG